MKSTWTEADEPDPTWVNVFGPQSPLSVDTSGLSFSTVSESTAGTNPSDDGVDEVQSISLPSEATGGTWSLNGHSLSWAATDDDVQDALGSGVTVTGGSGGFGVTWNTFGPQSLLSVDISGLSFPDCVGELTAGANRSSDGSQEVQSISLPAGSGKGDKSHY